MCCLRQKQGCAVPSTKDLSAADPVLTKRGWQQGCTAQGTCHDSSRLANTTPQQGNTNNGQQTCIKFMEAEVSKIVRQKDHATVTVGS